MALNRSIFLVLWLVGAILLQYVACRDENISQNECSTGQSQVLLTFDRSTRRFVRWLRHDPPIELIKEVIHSPEMWSGSLTKKIVSYERPFLVVSGVLCGLAFVTLISGIALIYLSIFGKAVEFRISGNARSWEFHKKWICGYVYVLVLGITSILLLMTVVGLFQVNNQISASLPELRNTLTKSIDDLELFQNDTMQELNRILLNDFENTIGDSMAKSQATCGPADSLAGSMNHKAVMFKEATKSAVSALKDTSEVLSKVNLTLAELQTLFKGLKSELKKMNHYFKKAQKFCPRQESFTDNGNLCKMLIDEKASARKEPLGVSKNVLSVISKLDRFLRRVNVIPFSKIIESRSKVKLRVCKERAFKLKELEKLCNGLRFARSFVLDSVKKFSDELSHSTLRPIRWKVDTALASDSSLLRYDRYRWSISFFISFGILLTLFSSTVSVALKRKEPFLSKRLSSLVKLNTFLAAVLRRLFVSSIVSHLLLALVASISSGLLFIVLSNMAVACDMANDYENLDKIFATSDLLKKSNLFNDERKPIRMFRKIRDCPEDGTLWSMFNLDKKLNMNKTIREVNYLPHITGQLFKDSLTSKNSTDKSFEEMKNILQQWKQIRLKSINAKLILQQVNTPVVNPSFRKLLNTLRRSVSGDNTMFQRISDQAFIIEEDYIKMYAVLSKMLGQHLAEFNKSRAITLDKFANVSEIFMEFGEGIDHHVMKIVEVVKDYLKDSVSKVRHNVGSCATVKRAYSNSVCSFCGKLLPLWNIWWVLLVVCSVQTTLSAIFSVLILRRMSENDKKNSNVANIQKRVLRSVDGEALD